MKGFQTISDDGCVEVVVGYNYEISESQIEECHGFHEVGNRINVNLEYVEVVIAGIGVQILPMLTQKQTDTIINNLNFDS